MTKKNANLSDGALRIPPQSLEAEQALLGSILMKQDALYEVGDYINEEVFYAEKHRLIFGAMWELHNAGEPIDILSLSEKLKSKKQLETIGGDAYLAELTTVVPTAANVEHYAGIVHEKYVKRSLISAAEEITTVGFDEARPSEEAIDAAEKELFAISNSMAGSEFLDMANLAKDAGERLMALQDGGDKLRGCPTGFMSLDRKLSGFQPSDLIILAARPSVGKTSLALDFMRNISVNHKKSVAFFSLEMSKDQITDRLIAAEARVDYWKLRTGTLGKNDKNEFDLLSDAISRLSEAGIHVDDSSYNNILRMKSAARKLMRKKGLDLIIVDYLQLMAPMKTGPNSSPVQEVTEISRGLKQLAKELNVPVIALSQLSRNIEHRGNDEIR